MIFSVYVSKWQLKYIEEIISLPYPDVVDVLVSEVRILRNCAPGVYCLLRFLQTSAHLLHCLLQYT